MFTKQESDISVIININPVYTIKLSPKQLTLNKLGV